MPLIFRLLLTLIIILSMPHASVFAQAGGGGGAGGGNGGGAGGGNGGAAAGGILIDADGVVTATFKKEKSSALITRKLKAFAKENLSADLNTPSTERKISLTRLEKELSQLLDEGKPIPEEMRYLAGLQRIDYVYISDDNKDLVIAGPAEGFAPNSVGRRVGTSNGRPAIALDDLLVALRTILRQSEVGCSIDPEQSRLANVQRYIAQNSSPATTSVVRSRYQRMAKILGNQNIRVWGVPGDSGFARTLVEADVLLKRLALGVEHAQVRGFKTHLSLIRPQGNSMQRWWFTPLYDAFQTTEDRTVFKFTGQRLQVLSQEEIVISGVRSDSATTRKSTQLFAKIFTDKMPELAEKHPSLAELQNLTDLAILVALIKKENLAQKLNWSMALFLDAAKLPTVKYFVPKEVASLNKSRSVGSRMVIGLISGGVVMKTRPTLDSMVTDPNISRTLLKQKLDAESSPKPESHPWWWD